MFTSSSFQSMRAPPLGGYGAAGERAQRGLALAGLGGGDASGVQGPGAVAPAGDGPGGDAQQRLQHDPLAHLGDPADPLGEGDRHLDHPEALLPGAMGHLHLEAVAVGGHRRDRQGLQRVVAPLDPPGEPGPVRHAQPLLAVAAQQVRARLGLDEPGDQVAGAVGAGVVDHQDLRAPVGGQDLGDHLLDRVDLVVGGDDDECSHWLPRIAACSGLDWVGGGAAGAGRRRIHGKRVTSAVATAIAIMAASMRRPARAYRVSPSRGVTGIRRVACWYRPVRWLATPSGLITALTPETAACTTVRPSSIARSWLAARCWSEAGPSPNEALLVETSSTCAPSRTSVRESSG